jgi:hypothetical protein
VWGWYKVDVLANRSETNKIASGAAGIAAFAGAVGGWPGRILAGGLGIYSAWAGCIYNNGGCVKFNVTYWGGIYAWYYYPWNHRYCR